MMQIISVRPRNPEAMSEQEALPQGTFPQGLRDPEAQLDPFDWYDRQRRTGPVHYDEIRNCYDVFDYENAKWILSGTETFSVDGVAHGDRTEEGTNVLADSMLYQDPPRHTDLRGGVEDFFTPGAIKELAPDIRALADELIDTAVTKSDGTFDFIESFAYPLPVTTIAGILGIPEEDRDQFRSWSTAAIQADSNAEASQDRREELIETHQTMRKYFSKILEHRRQEPKDDLLSRLVQLDSLSVEEIFGFTNLLLVAGNVTTTSLIANTVWTLGENDWFEELRGNEELIEQAVEEVLRYRSPVQIRPRYTKESVAVGDYEVPEGSAIVVWIGSANRDPDAFKEPDTFDPTRHPNRHIGFGHGIHICLGAALARLEGRTALERLLDSFEAWQPVVDGIEPSGSMIVYGPSSLPIRYQAKS